jgi:hypothetical protein
MEKNNPVNLANSERKFIWPKPSEHSRDIVLSIGTGDSTDFDGIREQDPALSKLLQSLQKLGIVRKIVKLKSQLESALNCEKMWNAFKNALGSDLHLLGKCHRINIPFGTDQHLCSLDDVHKCQISNQKP